MSGLRFNEQARRCNRPNRVCYPTDWLFTSRCSKSQREAAIYLAKQELLRAQPTKEPIVSVSAGMKESLRLREQLIKEMPGTTSLFKVNDYKEQMNALRTHYNTEVALASRTAQDKAALNAKWAKDHEALVIATNKRIAQEEATLIKTRMQGEAILDKYLSNLHQKRITEAKAENTARQAFNEQLLATGRFGSGSAMREKWAQYYEKGQSQFAKKGFTPIYCRLAAAVQTTAFIAEIRKRIESHDDGIIRRASYLLRYVEHFNRTFHRSVVMTEEGEHN